MTTLSGALQNSRRRLKLLGMRGTFVRLRMIQSEVGRRYDFADYPGSMKSTGIGVEVDWKLVEVYARRAMTGLT